MRDRFLCGRFDRIGLKIVIVVVLKDLASLLLQLMVVLFAKELAYPVEPRAIEAPFLGTRCVKVLRAS